MSSTPAQEYIDDSLEVINVLEKNHIQSFGDENHFAEDNIKSQYKTLFLLLKKKAVGSDAPEKHAVNFVYNVLLDVERDNNKRLNLKELFNIYCEKGNKYWLNPMEQIRKLDETLAGYSGDRSYIVPFLDLLKEVAAAAISPEAFLRYVVMPRMGHDNNFRDWSKNHLEVLKIIFYILKELKKSEVFKEQVIGTDKIRLSRDIVLIKYIGRPLACLTLRQLSDKSLIADYIHYCKELIFDHSLCIYFMKYNTLKFLSVLSGKIELFQMVQILEKTVKIQQRLKLSISEDRFSGIIEDHNFNFYGEDILVSIKIKMDKGFKTSDLIKDFVLYLDLVSTVITKSVGIYMLRGFVKDFIKSGSIEAGQNMIKLFANLKDSNSLHFYVWHKRYLLSKKKTYERFFEEIDLNNGCHPDYPRLGDIFSDYNDREESIEVNSLISSMNIPLETLKKVTNNRLGYSYRDLLNAYIIEYPEKESVIKKFQDECIGGNERSWSITDIDQFDYIGQKFHPVLMRSVIKGLGRDFSSKTTKTTGLSSLYSLYKESNTQKYIRVSSTFSMPKSNLFDQNEIVEYEIRKQINLQEINSLFNNLIADNRYNINTIATFISNEFLECTKKVEELQGTIINIGNEIAEKRNAGLSDSTTDLMKKESKIKKQLDILNDKKNNLNSLLNNFNNYSDLQKLVIGIYYSGSGNNRGEDMETVVLSLILERYAGNEDLMSRISFLKDDIIVDIITFLQFGFIINTLDTLIQIILNDEEVKKLLELHDDNSLKESFVEIIRPFIITRSKKVKLDSLEAALKKTTSYNKLLKIKSNWQNILDSVDKKQTSYYSNYALYTSKCFIDAYYGDMGGICLSGYSSLVNNPAFHNIRLVDSDVKQIIGMAILYISTQGIRSAGIKNFIYFFAINPLHSFLFSLSTDKQRFVYLEFRKLVEEFSTKTGLPVVIPGVGSSGIISNSHNFADIIIRFEREIMRSRPVHDAKGLSLYYESSCYQNGLLIIDPKRPETFTSDVYD